MNLQSAGVERNPSHGHLELSGLTKLVETDAGPLVIVEDFDIALGSGEFVCIVGPAGCGKSTVVNMVAGLTAATSGCASLDGKEITGPGPDRSLVLRAPYLVPWMNACENVILGVNQVYWQGTHEERERIARHYLAMVGLEDEAELRPDKLSRATCQRIALARAFSLAPKALVLDDPFAMTDSFARMELQEVLFKLWEDERPTTLMATDDVDEALFLADRIVVMTDGPRAGIADVVEVPIDRPRIRAAVFDDPRYEECRAHVRDCLRAQENGNPL